jgi:hypothetical protein
VFAEPHHVDPLTGTKKPPDVREVQSCILIWGFASFPSLNTFAPPANKAKEEYEYEKDKAYKVSNHRFVLFTQIDDPRRGYHRASGLSTGQNEPDRNESSSTCYID